MVGRNLWPRISGPLPDTHSCAGNPLVRPAWHVPLPLRMLLRRTTRNGRCPFLRPAVTVTYTPPRWVAAPTGCSRSQFRRSAAAPSSCLQSCPAERGEQGGVNNQHGCPWSPWRRVVEDQKPPGRIVRLPTSGVWGLFGVVLRRHHCCFTGLARVVHMRDVGHLWPVPSPGRGVVALLPPLLRAQLVRHLRPQPLEGPEAGPAALPLAVADHACMSHQHTTINHKTCLGGSHLSPEGGPWSGLAAGSKW